MKALFLGGDKRQIEIIKDLSRKKTEIDLVGYDLIGIDNIKNIDANNICISQYDLIFFPISGVKDDLSIACSYSSRKIILQMDLLEKCKEKAKIFTGIKTEKLNHMLKLANKDCIALMDDADIKKANGIPTVEGIIGDLIYSTDYTISDANIFVLGYGNVGKPLVRTLKNLNANVTVGIIKPDEFTELVNNQIPCIYSNNHSLMLRVMQDSNIIINTVPEIILNKDYLEKLNKDIYILDISSHPHGVDFESANELNLKNKLLLGIPGNVAPKTAGNILVKKINSIIKEDVK